MLEGARRDPSGRRPARSSSRHPVTPAFRYRPPIAGHPDARSPRRAPGGPVGQNSSGRLLGNLCRCGRGSSPMDSHSTVAARRSSCVRKRGRERRGESRQPIRMTAKSGSHDLRRPPVRRHPELPIPALINMPRRRQRGRGATGHSRSRLSRPTVQMPLRLLHISCERSRAMTRDLNATKRRSAA